LTARLQTLERQIRRQRPAFASSVLPQPVALAAIQSALAKGSALVVFASGARRHVAFVVTASAACVVPIEVAPELLARARAGTLDAQVLAALGHAVCVPALAARAAASDEPLQRLWLAPSAELATIPFELCPGGAATGNAPHLVDACDVAFAPSGTAWFAQHRQREVNRARAKSGTLAIADPPANGTASGPAWIAAALAPFVNAAVRANPPIDHPRPMAPTEWRTTAAAKQVIALSVPIAAERAGSAVECGGLGLSQGQLRDVELAADLVLLHAAGGQGGGPPEAMRRLAQSFWCATTPNVITVAAGVSSPAAQRAVAAAAASIRRHADPVRAWCEAMRSSLRQGAAVDELIGIRLWTASR
jgi:hypothetical protein